MDTSTAPKTGPGFSAGSTPGKVSKTHDAPHPHFSDGAKKPHIVDRKSDASAESDENWPGGRGKG